MKRWEIIFLLFLVAGTAYILTGNVPYQKEEGNIFGTTYRITYKSKKSYKEEIKNTLQQVDNSLSPFNKSSIISKINNNEDATPDSMFLYVINMAQQVSQATDGAFDITVAPLVNAWGFGFKKGIEPDSATIEEMLSYTGYNKISLADGKIKKEHPQTMLNCSAIAKGYGCDAVARMLRSKGIDNYMVEIGGEVALKGVNSKDNRSKQTHRGRQADQRTANNPKTHRLQHGNLGQLPQLPLHRRQKILTHHRPTQRLPRRTLATLGHSHRQRVRLRRRPCDSIHGYGSRKSNAILRTTPRG